MQWIRENVLNEDVVTNVVRRVREQLDDHAAAATARLPALENDAKALRAKIGRIVEAIASVGVSGADPGPR